ncbi:MAG: D-aminoacylase [Candidatus Aminicenantes bacterium]|nr:D-aminoacylase [Candidatus Aminicenantes bacterium]
MKLKTAFIVILVLAAVLIIYFAFGAIFRPDFDIIIKNGTIVDGSGQKPYPADIGILKGKIKEIGALAGKKAAKIIDATGLMVCPGFIDIHTHAGRNLLKHPDAHNYILQGVTTVLGGNCGGSCFPIGSFLEEVEKKKIALNFCTLVGHNTIRKKVMGNADRDPETKELEEMKKLTAQAMKDGAVGISTGLKYIPGAFAKTAEVIELAKVVQQYGGFYATHMREEGIDVLKSLQEAIAVGKAAKIPVQISHHKITGIDNWGSSVQTLALVEEARKAGINVLLDQYPYPATGTGLTVLFPPWSLEGEKKKWIERWKNAELRPRLIAEIKYNIEHDRGGNDLNRIMISRYSPEPELEGLTIEQILEKKNLPVTLEQGVELIIRLQTKEIEEDGQSGAIYFCLSDEDIERIMKYPHTAHASDGAIRTFGLGNPHPRNYGTFPRVLRLYVREKGILTFPEAIRKMTSLPAQRLGFKDRGSLKEGYYADIAIVDAAKVADVATWQEPHRYPVGIPYVLVNGRLVVENSKITGIFPGLVLRGKGNAFDF